MVIVRAFSSFFAIVGTALWWLDGWLPFRVQLALSSINILCRFVQMKRDAQIKTQS